MTYTPVKHGWSCDGCGALVAFTSVHDAWHALVDEASVEYIEAVATTISDEYLPAYNAIMKSRFGEAV